MRKMKKLFFALLCVLALGMVWTACDLGVDKGETVVEGPITITKQPQDTKIARSATVINVIPLSVAATAKNGSTLSYQWYSNTSKSNTGGTEIPGANASTYTPPLELNSDPGPYFYYVVITNTLSNEQVTSVAVEYTIIIEPSSVNNTVTVDIGTKYQYVRGFGGSMIIWDNFPDDRVEDYETMCNPVTGLGLNVFRIMIPPDYTDMDYMMKVMTENWDPPINRHSGTWWYDDHEIPPPTNAQGHTGKDQSDYYDIVKKINQHGGYVLGSPWTPPAYWKKNKSIVGGQDDYLLPEYYDEYAEWLRRFAEIMYEHGAPVYTISLQNEFTYSTDGGYEGCQYTSAQHQNFWVKEGQFFENNPPVPGWGGGKAVSSVQTMSGEAHSTIDSAFNSVIGTGAGADEARKGINILGRHIYGATNNSPTAFLNNAQFHPTDPKEVWQTEWSNGSPDSPLTYTWNYVWVFMSVLDYTIRHCNESAFIWFPSKSFHAILGDGGDGTINGEPLPRGYGMSQYAKFAKETGRVGVSVTGDNANRVNPTDFAGSNAYTSSEYLGPKITAYVTLNDDFYAGPVDTRHRRWRGLDGSGLENLDVSKISAISLVMFTPTDNNGSSGVNLGSVKIQLPEGFKVGGVAAMRSIAGNYCAADSGNVTIGADGNYAFVTLPAGNVLSVRFEKAQ